MTQTGSHESAIAEAEAEYLTMRRKKLAGAKLPFGKSHIGLALSGGGIRSATLSLGVLTSLSRLGLCHQFDYLSSVSGGGYTGAFYVSFFTPPTKRGMANDEEWTSPLANRDPLGTPGGAAAIHHLRENGRYLLSSGSGDAIRLAAITIRGWLAIQLVIGITLLAGFLFLKSLQATLMHWHDSQLAELWLAENRWSTALWPLQWLQGYPLGKFVVLSPVWPVVVPCLAMAVALGWAFWLTRSEAFSIPRLPHFIGPSSLITVLIGFVCLYTFPGGCLISFLPDWPRGHLADIIRTIGVLAIGAFILFLAAEWRESRDIQLRGASLTPALSAPREREDRVRFRLTGWTAFWLRWAIIVAIVATIDSIAETFYCLYIQNFHRGAGLPLAAGGLVVAATPIIRSIITWAQTAGRFRTIFWRFGRLIALFAGLALAFLILVVWATLAQYIAWRGGPIGAPAPLIADDRAGVWTLSTVWVPTILFLLLAAGIGISIGFLNLSTFSEFYASRLRRAYLGASNARRIREGMAADTEDEGDDIALQDYYGVSGAPLHLINCTINETTPGKMTSNRGEGASSLVQRDRKGRPLTVSPAGYLYPTDIADTRERFKFSEKPGEDLPLSKWAAISGAAISTGLGQNTSLGLALLAGLANLRLGVWWTPPGKTGLWAPQHWVQAYLKTEFLAKFKGIYGQRWYLTDGGHFENTGVYELVRRRVRLIVACDNGADPDYTFVDIVNLTRKLRIDFNANLEFLSTDKLDKLLGADTTVRGMFGELSDLMQLSNKKVSSGPYAAIGRITIRPTHPATCTSNGPADPQEAPTKWAYVGTLILLKPRITGMEMTDMLDYRRINPQFPQQSTGDQFFDEAQWESYYRLGTLISDYVFTKHNDPPALVPRWSPAELVPVDEHDFAWFAEDWGPLPPKSPPAVTEPGPPATARSSTWHRVRAVMAAAVK